MGPMEAGGRPDGSAIGMVIADAVSGSDAGGTRALGWFQSTSDNRLQARLLDGLALEAGIGSDRDASVMAEATAAAISGNPIARM